MPLGRHKVPFSGKAKKQQLKEKKQRQQYKNELLTQTSSKNFLVGRPHEKDEFSVLSVNEQPTEGRGKRNPNRYNLQFHRETEEELKKRKEQARKTIVPVEEEKLEVNIDDVFPPELDFPVRPPWEFTMSRGEVDARENRYFTEYLKNIEEKFSWSELSYFELNLETWRQLWRVLEMSDIVLLITDIRFPALMLPPSLYKYVSKTLRKALVVVLNKIDLVPSSVVVAWKHYLKEKYPGIHIIMFTSYPAYNLRNNSPKHEGLQVKRRRGKMRMAAEGAQKLFDACNEIVKGQVDLTSWQEKISEEMTIEHDIGEEEVEIVKTVNLRHQDTFFQKYTRYEGGILTIGCVGQPNVGKSSLMNALMGKKVVSVSRTPGHTKHFQTIFLTNTVRLCDCPGLVFPSKVPKSLQILMGSFPIAQLREPYSCIQFLAERVDLVSMLKIQHPEKEDTWSAMDICDGWAQKKGFYTAKAARLDTYRAANHLLRMALEGKIPFFMLPPGYSSSKEKWATHTDIKVVEWIQAASLKHNEDKDPSLSDFESDEEEEEGARSHVDSGSYGHKSQSSAEDDSNNESGGENIQSLNKFEALNVTD